MCPGMPHAKFQSPSINIDIYFQLSFGERKGERKKEREKGRKEVKDPRCRAPHLPKGLRRRVLASILTEISNFLPEGHRDTGKEGHSE